MKKNITSIMAHIVAGLIIASPFVAVGGVTIGVWVFQSHMEAKAYNRVTGSDVTTWEAMWIQLRVQEGTNRR